MGAVNEYSTCQLCTRDKVMEIFENSRVCKSSFSPLVELQRPGINIAQMTLAGFTRRSIDTM
jgi:hypothetical protein